MSQRFDLLITGERSTHSVPRAGLHAVLRWLASSGYATPDAEAVARSWVAIYGAPGPSAHTVFVDGEAPDEPVFTELCLWTGPREPLPYGDGEAAFFLEFRGCRYDRVLAGFRRRLGQLVNIRPRVITRPHVPDVGHRIVPEDQRPEATARPAKLGAVGTRVEEF